MRSSISQCQPGRPTVRNWFTAGAVALVLLSSSSGAVAQPTTTPSPPAAQQSVPADPSTPTDPCATRTTTTATSTSTVPPTTTTTTTTTPPCETTPPPVSSTTTTPAPTDTSVPQAVPEQAPASEQNPAADAPTTKIPYTGLPTENPNDTIIPGKMRSDREELPEGYTKEEADKTEIWEAQLLKQKSMQRGVSALAAPTDCMPYWPVFNIQVCGEIRVKYDSLGGSTSFLGPPTAGDVANPDNYGRRQTFVNGPIYWSPATGAHPVVNSFLFRWGQNGYEAGWLKYPTTDEIVLPDGGRRQEFQTGAIYVAFQNAVGSAIRNGPIRDKWNSVGAEAGPLGYVSSDEIPVTKNAGRYNNFVNGTITWSQPTGARLLFGVVRDRWASTGREDGPAGYPTADEQVLPDGIGHAATFEDKSAIYSYPILGAWFIPANIISGFRYMGYEQGELGYPTEAAVLVNNQDFSIRQKFQRGYIALGVSDGKFYVLY